ncbi:MAG: prepilin-type N-terminal cleavage/methylation domain-containing protein [Desulfosarcinaceae bacterium]|jgi:general secretion pathway protein J
MYKSCPVSKGASHAAPTPADLRRRRAREGFTLIEILLAIFIFSILVGTVFGSFAVLSDGADVLKTDTSLRQGARASLERITQDLKEIHFALPPEYHKPEFNDDPSEYRLVGGQADVGNTDFDQLRFASLAHIPFQGDPRLGIARIVYYPAELTPDRWVLRRADHLYPYPDFEPSEQDPILCEDLLEFKLTYIDGEGADFDRWDTESDDHNYASPRAIAITLKTGTPERAVTLKTTVDLPVYRLPLEEE